MFTKIETTYLFSCPFEPCGDGSTVVKTIKLEIPPCKQPDEHFVFVLNAKADKQTSEK